ncbi:MAG: nicotinate-nucleotide adenylyltransferase [Acidiferrobacterales bacterium]|nr:nicotinate-nucleotide adenylyltransferase [Acidiferrobacterales bacterium]
MKPIGVFGGTFDPIHFGHIRPMLEIRESTGISQVHYIPNSRPGHRDQPQTASIHRWNMMVLALDSRPDFVADDRELRRAGMSYMVTTLRSLRSEFALRPLCLILGMDAFLHIHRWYWWADVLKLANIIVMNRPGADFPNQLPGWWLQALEFNPWILHRKMSGCILHVAVERVNISATELRSRIARGDDCSESLPESVYEYINKHNLYQSTGGTP